MILSSKFVVSPICQFKPLLLPTSFGLQVIPWSIRCSSTSSTLYGKAELKKESARTDDNDTLTLTDTDQKNKYYLSKSWAHPTFTKDQMESIKVEHKEPQTISDKIAFKTMRLFRTSFDTLTGYIHPPIGEELNPRYRMNHKKWLIRFIFLESVAGVPGMVGGTLRHLHSLRALKHDRAWMETLLEEAYNERMHLLTFLKLSKPGIFMRLMLFGAQGVFFNLFFLCYLTSPKTCHRFVGYLEEEAVVTYSRCLEDIDNGLLPEWDNLKVPSLAIEYWKMGPNATMRDLIMYIRADEAKHREVNHTLGNLDQKTDRNPFAEKVDNGLPQPSKDLSTHKGCGWKRDEISL